MLFYNDNLFPNPRIHLFENIECKIVGGVLWLLLSLE